ncbi:MAG TPA: hypothetical protein PLK28_12920 [Candidatus Rifleibacterium sp.]|nr:hypothetical protein [Candidatus Rifleibacterium sp.]
MKSPRQVILDSSGKNPLQEGFLLVSTVLELLENIGYDDAKLHVRGSYLCDWYKKISLSRGWARPEFLDSPFEELLRLFPDMNEEQAKNVLSRIGSFCEKKRPLNLFLVARAIWPEDINLWNEILRSDSFARWLLWRWEVGKVQKEEAIVLSKILEIWHPQLEFWGITLDAKDHLNIPRMIFNWLAGKTNLPPNSWPIRDLEELDIHEEICKIVQSEIAEQGYSFFYSLLYVGADPYLISLAGERLSMKLFNEPNNITQEILFKVSPHVSYETFSKLKTFLRPSQPEFLPGSIANLKEWFIDKYLPFRNWQVDDETHREICNTIGRRFGEWYLRAYSMACNGGEGSQMLGFQLTNALRKPSENKVLLIILDGATFSDGLRIAHLIKKECPRLTLSSADIAFGPVPTVTQFAKMALKKGAAPGQFAVTECVGVDQSLDNNVKEVLSLNDFSPVIWRFDEPDNTYHKQNDDLSVLDTEIDGRLKIIAKRIARVCEASQYGKKLKVIITSDHGRILGTVRRSEIVPDGMEAHGRCAWGGTHEIEFDKDGIFINSDLAWLSPPAFGLEKTTAVLLSDKMFVTKNGRQNVGNHPHGGVFPEEVLIPWITMLLDQGKALIQAKLKGKGIAGHEGTFILVIKNPESYAITVNSAVFNKDFEILFEKFIVNPMTSLEKIINVKVWPLNELRESLTASLVIEFADGHCESVPLPMELETQELYKRPDILSDF